MLHDMVVVVLLDFFSQEEWALRVIGESRPIGEIIAGLWDWTELRFFIVSDNSLCKVCCVLSRYFRNLLP